MNHLEGLNGPQLEAVKHLSGPILVLAGAGSGKTRVLTSRVANLILEHGVQSQNIFAVTFTNKATEEMRSRLLGLLGNNARDLWISTFHSAALRILRRNAKLLSYSHDFVVYDDDDSKALMRELLKKMGVVDKKYSPQMFLRAIDRAKNSFILPSDYIRDSARGYLGTLVHEVYDRYQKELIQSDAMDFGDLLVNVVRLFKEFPDVLDFYQRNIKFVLVDEFQDTNEVQYMFIRLLTAKHKNLLVVGDDDQSIYAFRGASISNILNFEKDFRGAKVVKLEENYRSSGNILEMAHAVIQKNVGRKDKKLWTSRDKGAAAQLVKAADETTEAQFIAQKITELKEAGVPFSDIAIFYRTNAQSRAIEDMLTYAAIPYRIYGGLKFYDRKEIKDIIAYLRLIINRVDNQAFLRTVNTPPRGIGPQTLQSVINQAGEDATSYFEAALKLANKNANIKNFCELIDQLRSEARSLFLSELLEQVIERSDYGPKLQAMKDIMAQARLENLAELKALARTFEVEGTNQLETLRSFLDRVSLSTSDERPREEPNGAAPKNEEVSNKDPQRPNLVSLMTLHLAKGLEFPVVFLTGVEEGLLPHYRALEDLDGLEEERRLCYVGITRAMHTLYISVAAQRGMLNRLGFASGVSVPSRFLSDIPNECIECINQEPSNGFDSDDTDPQLLESEEAPKSKQPEKIYYRRKGPFNAKGLVRPADEL